MDAYIFAEDATTQARTDALALVGDEARAVLPVSSDRELYVAVAGADPAELLTNIAAVVTIDGLTGVTTHIAIGSSSAEATFPTHGTVDDYVGFALLDTAPTSTVSVWEAALETSGVVGAAMVSGTGSVDVLVEATSDSTNTLASILATVAGLTGVNTYVTVTGPVSGGAGFTTS